MRQRGVRLAGVVLFVIAVSIAHGTAQTVKQGEVASPEKRYFTSPLVLETVFAAADRSLWDPAKGHAPGAWFSGEEYGNLGKFSCDGVYLRSKFDFKTDKWLPGLAMSVTEAAGGMLAVKVRAMVDNPKGNRDRYVTILFEALNGDTVIASAAPPKRSVEEKNEKPIVGEFTLKPEDLVADPMTKLRLTVRTELD